MERLIDLMPADFYPVRVRAKPRGGFSTKEDWKFWKRLYEELNFTMWEISGITGWGECTIRRELHKMGVKIIYTPRPHKKQVYK